MFVVIYLKRRPIVGGAKCTTRNLTQLNNILLKLFLFKHQPCPQGNLEKDHMVFQVVFNFS